MASKIDKYFAALLQRFFYNWLSVKNCHTNTIWNQQKNLRNYKKRKRVKFIIPIQKCMSHVLIHNSWKEWLGGTKRNLFSFVHLLHTRHLRNAFLTRIPFEYLYLCGNDINVQNHSMYYKKILIYWGKLFLYNTN